MFNSVRTEGLRKSLLYVLAALSGVAVAAGLYFVLGIGKDPLPAPSASGQALIGGPFELVDHTGAPVTHETYRGKPALLYFGYTSCPDICPIDLHKMAVGLDLLGKDAAKLQPLFVTIDPARDDVEAMKDYVESISPQLIGLTGSAEQIETIARAYKVYYAKTGSDGQPTDEEEGYWMSHSNVFYLMDEKGGFVTHFDANQTPEAMAAVLAKHLN